MELTQNQDGLLLDSRHGKKAKRAGVIPGSYDDKNFTHISEEGIDELARIGSKIFGDQKYQRVISEISDFIRTRESNAGYLRDSIVKGLMPLPNVKIVPEIGFGIPNVDWHDERLPKFGSDREVLNNYVETLYTNLYLRSDDPTLPAMCDFSAASLKSLVDVITKMDAVHKPGTKTAGTILTHAPVIDGGTMHLLPILSVEQKNRKNHVNFNKEEFNKIGAFAEGEFYYGILSNLGSGNPNIELTIKVNGDYFNGANIVPVQIGYNLSDLKRKYQTAAQHTRLQK